MIGCIQVPPLPPEVCVEWERSVCVYMCICVHGHNAWFEFLKTLMWYLYN